MASADIRRLNGWHYADGGIFVLWPLFAHFEQEAAGVLTSLVIPHINHEGDTPSKLDCGPAIRVFEVVRDLANMPDHLAVFHRQPARAALPVVKFFARKLRMLRAPLAHELQRFVSIFLVEGNYRHIHNTVPPESRIRSLISFSAI